MKLRCLIRSSSGCNMYIPTCSAVMLNTNVHSQVPAYTYGLLIYPPFCSTHPHFHPSLSRPHSTASHTSPTTTSGLCTGSLPSTKTPLLTRILRHLLPAGLTNSLAPRISLSGLSPTIYTRFNPSVPIFDLPAPISACLCLSSLFSAKANVSWNGFPNIFFSSLAFPVTAFQTPSKASRKPPWPRRGR